MPWSHLPRLKVGDASTCFFTNAIEKTQQFLDEKCKQYNAPPISVDRAMQQHDGSPKKGDFSILIAQSQYSNLIAHLEEISEALQSELSEVFSDCKLVDGNRLILRLNRERAYRSGLRQAVALSDRYGANSKNIRGTVLLLVHDDSTMSLTNFRTRVISEHLASVILMNGYRLYCRDGVLSNVEHLPWKNNLVQYNCQQCNDETGCFQQACIKSTWYINDDVEHSALDGKKYLTDLPEKTKQYDKNIGLIYLKKGSYTDTFKESARMYHVLKNHVSEVDLVLSVVPLNKRFLLQQCGMVLEMTSRKLPRSFHIVHQQVLQKNPENMSSETYKQQRLLEMEQALVQKYGEDILNDATWLSIIRTVTETVVKFDFLLTGFSVPLKIDGYDRELGIRDKGGAFVQYNCARLAMIFKHYEEKLEAGKYEPSPNIEAVDFTQLKLQEEWHLYFNYVLPFQANVQNLLEVMENNNSLQINILTNRVCQFLVSLSRDLSVYYNKNRVLVEPYPQLLAKMYPRLYLLRAIHQVMKNGLAMLNLKAVEKM